ncbi:hypothetical protein BDY24DRAFT_401839 [Mrakia frigida]|uniref:uncharacterized protein n=1 Tax=Mrakia frigida TaxID=29902 RepID=UPI003FCBFD2F
MCAVCTAGTRSDALTCSAAAITGSLSPQRRRDRILKEKQEQYALSELESCGGCRSNGTGVDCSSLAGVKMGASTCTEGLCVVYACKPGWQLKFDRCFRAVVEIR